MLSSQRGPVMSSSLYIEGTKKLGLCLIVLISLFQVKCTFFMVFTNIRGPLLADNFLFFSYIFDINFLYLYPPPANCVCGRVYCFHFVRTNERKTERTKVCP